jgi:hypothetical protein
MTLDVERALGPLMEDAATTVQHVERDHAGHHDLVRQPLSQEVPVAYAVLEADNNRTGLQCLGQLTGRTLSRGRLHRHQHQVGLRSGPRCRLIPHVSNPKVRPEIVSQPQPMLSQLVRHPLPPDERHRGPGRRQPPAGITPDPTRAVHHDPHRHTVPKNRR